MPFASKAQQRFAFATHQPWAKEFADKTNFKNLPDKKKNDDKKKAIAKKIGATQ